MKIIYTVLLSLLISVKSFGLTHQSQSDAIAKSQASPSLYPWWNGAIGVTKSGATLGDPGRETGAWPVGEYAFITASHINPIPDKSFLYKGKEYQITNTYSLGNDLKLYLVNQKLPTYNAVWRGWKIESYLREFKDNNGNVIFKMQDTRPIDLTGKEVLIVSGGPLSWVDSSDCGAYRPFQKSYGKSQNSKTIISDLKFQNVISSYNSNLDVLGLPNELVSPSLQIPFTKTDGVGVLIGDSGGACFLNDNGTWYLIGLLNQGSSCLNGEVVAGIAYNALLFQDAFWAEIPQPNKKDFYQGLRAHFAETPKYVDGPVATPIPPDVGIPSSGAVTTTNTVTITNVLYELRTNFVYMTNTVYPSLTPKLKANIYKSGDQFANSLITNWPVTMSQSQQINLIVSIRKFCDFIISSFVTEG